MLTVESERVGLEGARGVVVDADGCDAFSCCCCCCCCDADADAAPLLLVLELLECRLLTIAGSLSIRIGEDEEDACGGGCSPLALPFCAGVPLVVAAGDEVAGDEDDEDDVKGSTLPNLDALMLLGLLPPPPSLLPGVAPKAGNTPFDDPASADFLFGPLLSSSSSLPNLSG